MLYLQWLWASYVVGQATAVYLSEDPAQSVHRNAHSTNAWSGRTLRQEATGLADVKTSSWKLSIKRKAPPTDVDPNTWSIVETNALARRRPQSEPGVSGGKEQQPRLLGTPIKRDNTYTVLTGTTPSQTNSVAIDEDGTDFFYFTTAQFGSSSKSMYMLVDTGSANTWVVGSGCTSKACTSHNIFGPADSSTLKSTPSKFNLTYGTGTVSGMIYNDTVKLAGMSLPLSFGLASTTSDDFSTYPMDGILGLGRPMSNNMESPSVMEVIEASKALPQNLLGISLQRNSDGSTGGELSFGAPDKTKYTGDLLYINTDYNGSMWEIPLGDTAVNGAACHFSGKKGIVDSGTSFLLLPPSDAKTVHDRIPNSGLASDGYRVPCSSTMPLQIIISDTLFNVSSKDWIGSPISGGSMCSSNIIARQTFGPDQWLLGDVFLKNVYTVFDFDKNRVGFGNTNIKESFPISSSSQEASNAKSSVTSSSVTTSSSYGISSSGSPSSATILLPASQVSMSSTASATASATASNTASSQRLPSSSTPATLSQTGKSSAARLNSIRLGDRLAYLLVFIISLYI